ncbi:MAG: hypothetical protein QM756_18980 [Polyangiaceae bacterium]
MGCGWEITRRDSGQRAALTGTLAERGDALEVRVELNNWLRQREAVEGGR